jgi:hypothetical protein
MKTLGSSPLIFFPITRPAGGPPAANPTMQLMPDEAGSGGSVAAAGLSSTPLGTATPLPVLQRLLPAGVAAQDLTLQHIQQLMHAHVRGPGCTQWGLGGGGGGGARVACSAWESAVRRRCGWVTDPARNDQRCARVSGCTACCPLDRRAACRVYA